jgi:hypothetical protein
MPFRTKKINVDLGQKEVNVFQERKVEAQLNSIRSQQCIGSSSKKVESSQKSGAKNLKLSNQKSA